MHDIFSYFSHRTHLIMHEIRRFEMKTEQKCKIRMGEKSETNSVIFFLRDKNHSVIFYGRRQRHSVIAAKKLYEMNAEKSHRIRVYEPR